MHAAACLCYQDVVTDMPQIGMHGSPERCRSRLERAHAERVSAPESQSFTPLREPPDRTLYRCRPPEAAGAATYGQTYDDLLCLLPDPHERSLRVSLQFQMSAGPSARGS